jgi:hypothetical protein
MDSFNESVVAPLVPRVHSVLPIWLSVRANDCFEYAVRFNIVLRDDTRDRDMHPATTDFVAASAANTTAGDGSPDGSNHETLQQDKSSGGGGLNSGRLLSLTRQRSVPMEQLVKPGLQTSKGHHWMYARELAATALSKSTVSTNTSRSSAAFPATAAAAVHLAWQTLRFYSAQLSKDLPIVSVAASRANASTVTRPSSASTSFDSPQLRGRVLSTDTYADSLIFTNRLFVKAFAKRQRKVWRVVPQIEHDPCPSHCM